MASLDRNSDAFQTVSDVKDRFGKARIGSISGTRRGIVLQDVATGYFIKQYLQPVDARLQYETMNALSERFRQADLGIAAVRHFALVEPEVNTMPSVAIIEPAQGEPTGSIIGEDAHIEIAKDVRRRVKEAIGKRSSKTLVNDIESAPALFMRTRNIFFAEDGGYTLIDQPFYIGGRWNRSAVAALDRLGAADTKALYKMMEQLPPLDGRTR